MSLQRVLTASWCATKCAVSCRWKGANNQLGRVICGWIVRKLVDYVMTLHRLQRLFRAKSVLAIVNTRRSGVEDQNFGIRWKCFFLLGPLHSKETVPHKALQPIWGAWLRDIYIYWLSLPGRESRFVQQTQTGYCSLDNEDNRNIWIHGCRDETSKHA